MCIDEIYVMHIASTKKCHYRLQLVSSEKDLLADYVGLDAFISGMLGLLEGVQISLLNSIYNKLAQVQRCESL